MLMHCMLDHSRKVHSDHSACCETIGVEVFISAISERPMYTQVVRCFEDDNVIHVNNKVDPADDTEVINFELALADIAQIERRMERLTKKAKSKEEAAQQEV